MRLLIRLHTLLLTAALSLLVACSSARSMRPHGRTVDALIRAALAASVDAWNRGDLDGHVAVYADSTTLMSSDGPVRGRARARANFARYFAAGGRPHQQLRLERVEVRPLGQEHALATGRYVLSGGGVAEQTGWFSLVWARTPDGWRIIHDHSG